MRPAPAPPPAPAPTPHPPLTIRDAIAFRPAWDGAISAPFHNNPIQIHLPRYLHVKCQCRGRGRRLAPSQPARTDGRVQSLAQAGQGRRRKIRARQVWGCWSSHSASALTALSSPRRAFPFTHFRSRTGWTASRVVVDGGDACYASDRLDCRSIVPSRRPVHVNVCVSGAAEASEGKAAVSPRG